MGIQINPGQGKGTGAAKGVSMRLFSDFYISDVIIASPIALKLAIENGSDGSENSKVDSDFLSSLEIVYMHQADVLYMQNWEHVQFVMNHTNRLPKKFGDTDYSRVRPYFLDGEGAARRQIIMTTAFFEPEMQSTFRLNAKSSCGFAKIKRNWSMGSISNVAVDVRQVFQIVPGITGIDTLEVNKFNYFKSHILAPLLRLEQPHTLIVAPNYFQYVKIRNELIHQEVNILTFCCFV